MNIGKALALVNQFWGHSTPPVALILEMQRALERGKTEPRDDFDRDLARAVQVVAAYLLDGQGDFFLDAHTEPLEAWKKLEGR